MFRAMVTDDEGKRVVLVRFNASRVPWPYGPLPNEVQTAIRREIDDAAWDRDEEMKPQTHRRVARVVVYGLVIAVFVLPLMESGSTAGKFGAIVLFLVCVYLLERTAGTLMLCDRARHAAARVALAAGYCGSCGYPLSSGAEETSGGGSKAGTGLHRCPECGAAWWKGAVE